MSSCVCSLLAASTSCDAGCLTSNPASLQWPPVARRGHNAEWLMEDADEEKALDSAKENGALFTPAKPQPGDFDYVEPGQDLRNPWPELGRGSEPFEDEVGSTQPPEHTFLAAAACRRPQSGTLCWHSPILPSFMLLSCQLCPAGSNC